MTSAYTQNIVAGEESFESYLWGIARSFPAFRHMRDSRGATSVFYPDPDRVDPSVEETREWYRECLTEAEVELERLESMTEEEKIEDFRSFIAEATADYEKELRAALAVRERLRKMKAKVVSWEPPTPDHAGLKTSALSLLDEELEHGARLPREPSFCESANDRHALLVEIHQADIYRYKEKLATLELSKVRNLKSIKWIKELVDSVPPPEGAFVDGGRCPYLEELE